jgi:hypothetical protein
VPSPSVSGRFFARLRDLQSVEPVRERGQGQVLLSVAILAGQLDLGRQHFPSGLIRRGPRHHHVEIALAPILVEPALLGVPEDGGQ